MERDLAVAVDLGGTQVRAALVEGGRIVRRAAVSTDVRGGPKAVFPQILALVSEVCSKTERLRLAGVGVAAPGPLDSDRGIVLRIPTLPGWEGFALRDAVQDQFGLPALLENDGIAAAFGEWRFGAGKGLRHLVYVTVSTGIGGGVVADGRLLRGRQGMAGHIGHLTLVADGPRCSCGVCGHFEALASGTALGIRARLAAAAHPESQLAKFTGKGGGISAREVVGGARSGDPLCLELLREEATYLGTGFTALLHLFSPERLIMGGGVSQGFDLLRAGIEEVIRRDALEPFRNVPVVAAALGENSGLVGVAGLVMELMNPDRSAEGGFSSLRRAPC